MTLLIKTNNSARAGATKRVLPVIDGLQYLMLADAADDPGHNWALGKRDGTVFGTPVRGPDGISWRFKGLTNYVQSETWEVDSETHFCIARTFDLLNSDATRPAFFGTFAGRPVKQDTTTTTFGSRFYISTAGAVRYSAGRGNTVTDDIQADAAITVSNHQAYQLYVLKTDPINTTRSATTNLSATNASVLPRFPARNRYRIGSAYSTTGGECDILAYAKYDGALTDTQINAVVADLRGYCANLGVVV